MEDFEKYLESQMYDIDDKKRLRITSRVLRKHQEVLKSEKALSEKEGGRKMLEKVGNALRADLTTETMDPDSPGVIFFDDFLRIFTALRDSLEK